MPPPPWRPVIDGELRAAALDAVRDIARVLADPSHAATPGLSKGSTGLALLFGYLAQAEDDVPFPGAGDVARRYMEHARRHVADTVLPPTLYGGFVGVGWLHEHLRRQLAAPGGTDDQPDTLGALDAALLKLDGAPPWSTHYDLISGLVGLGVFALERVRSPARSAMLSMIARRLSAIAEPDDRGMTWRTPAKYLFDANAPAQGVIDLGVAHGVPGAMVLLAELAARGVREAEDCHRGAVDWLLSRRQEPPALSSFDTVVVSGRAPGRSRLAWCYGDPGVAAALCVAAVAAGDRDLLEHARRVAQRAARRDPATSGVRDAALCHGSMGLALCFQLLWVATSDEDCAAAARFWVRDALARRTEGGCAGFTRIFVGEDRIEVREPSAGFLNGAAGIALALLAASTSRAPAWARVMLAYPATSSIAPD